MRIIKMFGLAAIAAVAAMAFIGASSASATNTVLCKENVLVCPTLQKYTGHVEALTTHALLVGPVTVTCKHSHILGEALDLANPLIIHVTLLGFKECNCTVTVKDQTGLISVLKTAANLAGGSAEGFEVTVTCAGITCNYGGVAEGAHGLGSPTSTSDATIVATKLKLKVLPGSSFFCGEEPGLWTATYNVLLPLPIYIAE